MFWNLERSEGCVLDSAAVPFAGGLFPSPASDAEAGRTLDDAIRARKIAPGVIELLVMEHAARSLAVDLGRGWAELEAPLSSSIGEAMIRALEDEKPGHPSLYAGASHHHPHYIGGLRPLAHRGATILCPADVVDYVEHVLQRPRSLRPDELARSRNTVTVVGVEAGQRWPQSQDARSREDPGRCRGSGHVRVPDVVARGGRGHGRHGVARSRAGRRDRGRAVNQGAVFPGLRGVRRLLPGDVQPVPEGGAARPRWKSMLRDVRSILHGDARDDRIALAVCVGDALDGPKIGEVVAVDAGTAVVAPRYAVGRALAFAEAHRGS